MDIWTHVFAITDNSNNNKANKDDPTAGIMDLMKEMYDNGDDNMKKMIGETMYKQRTGQLGNNKDPMGMGMGSDDMMGMGDLGI